MYSPAAQASRIGEHACPSLLPEKVLPSVHAAHTRSSVSEPSADLPEPAGHVRHALHACWPGWPLKWPAAHVVHTRSDDGPGGVVSYVPGAQVVTALHTRSVVPVGALDVYWPSAQDSLCVWHSRSEVAEGTAISNSSEVHCVTATHASPLSCAEYDVSATQAVHSRSAAAVPAFDMPWPTPHVFHCWHWCWPGASVKCPAAHGAHVRSLLAVASAVMYSPAGHVARTLSQCALLAPTENVVPVVHAVQVRSATREPAAVVP
jgi:hypothetical protein